MHEIVEWKKGGINPVQVHWKLKKIGEICENWKNWENWIKFGKIGENFEKIGEIWRKLEKIEIVKNTSRRGCGPPKGLGPKGT